MKRRSFFGAIAAACLAPFVKGRAACCDDVLPVSCLIKIGPFEGCTCDCTLPPLRYTLINDDLSVLDYRPYRPAITTEDLGKPVRAFFGERSRYETGAMGYQGQ